MESLPQISMRPSARYVTQGPFYDSLLVVGPLTDKAIERYTLAGRYGPDAKRELEAELAVKKRAKPKRAASGPARAKRQVLADEITKLYSFL